LKIEIQVSWLYRKFSAEPSNENNHRSEFNRKAQVVEHPFGTIKLRMGAVHFLLMRLPKVRGEMALHVLAYNLTRVLNILGVQPLLAAFRA
jgi:hypothetical protein